jgi:hypothetical protein
MRRSVDMKTGDLTADGFGIRAGRENRRSVQSGTAVKLDALQAAIAIKQCPTRLSVSRDEN